MPRRVVQGGVAGDVIEEMRVCWLRYSSCRATTLELVRALGYRIEGEVKTPDELLEKMSSFVVDDVTGMPPAEAEAEALRRVYRDATYIVEVLRRLYPGLG